MNVRALLYLTALPFALAGCDSGSSPDEHSGPQEPAASQEQSHEDTTFAVGDTHAHTDATLADASDTADDSDDSDTHEPSDAAAEPGGDGEEDRVWSAALCPDPGDGVEAGYEIGNQLASMSFLDCDGNSVSLDDFCGADVLWIFMVHAWCGECKKVGAVAEEITAHFEGKNLAAVQVVVHSATSEMPTGADCTTWRNQYGLTSISTLYDNTFASILLAHNSTTAQSVLVDQDRIIRAKFNHSDMVQLIAEIQALY